VNSELFNKHQKKPPIRLKSKAYTKLREKVWKKQCGLCAICGYWFALERFSLHHKNTGGMGMRGDDTEENTIGCWLWCHPD
jgi:hypothetical protein